MPSFDPTFGLSIYQYSRAVHSRMHGPDGYEDYRSFKPWLRDEFKFRCVYCLSRERWCHDGSNGFGVDHLVPKSAPAGEPLVCNYDNLLYACNRCNTAKRISAVLDPCQAALADHLQITEDGVVVALTKEGEHLIEALNLNYSVAREYRRRKIEAFSRWQALGDTWTIEEELAFPDDLPQLDDRQCSNLRPDGVGRSCFALRSRGELSRYYV